jgi:hypothetical protein
LKLLSTQAKVVGIIEEEDLDGDGVEGEGEEEEEVVVVTVVEVAAVGVDGDGEEEVEGVDGGNGGVEMIQDHMLEESKELNIIMIHPREIISWGNLHNA